MQCDSRFCFKRLAALGLLAVASSGSVFAQQVATEASRQVPVQMISRQDFCNRLSTGLKQFGLASGYDAKQSGLIASAATDELVSAFKSGRASDYINSSALAPLAKLSGADAMVKAPGYIPMANFLAPALGILPAQTVLALSAAELRFIPHVQQGMNIIVIAQNAAPLTPERAKAVAETAGRLKIKIHVLWVGDSVSASGGEGPSVSRSESQAMAFLAAVTGGTYADLSGADHCGRSL
jgi:hypothetical protein